MVFWKGFSVNRNRWNDALLGTEQEKKRARVVQKECLLIGKVLLYVRLSTTPKPFENAHNLGSTVSI